MHRNEIRLYNVLFPIWLLVFIPSFLWLILIPANYLIDRTVLYYSLPEERRKNFCRRHTWKICIAGFLADFAGGLFLFGVLLLADTYFPNSNAFTNALTFNHFTHPLALLTILAAIALAGGLIYLMDRFILRRSGRTEEEAGHAAKRLALITAPYLFLIPSALIY